MKNIIIQIAAGSMGGIGRMTRDISSVLSKNGYENYIVFGRGEVFDTSRDYKIGTKLSTYIDAIQSRLLDNAGFNSIYSTRKLIRFLDKKRPNLIHLHNLHGYYINIELLFNYIKEKKIPVVWTLHDTWAMSGHCCYWDYVKCSKWKSHCNQCPAFKTYPKSFFDHSKENYVKKKNIFTGVENLQLITPSSWLSQITRESFLKEYPVNIINNGVDLDLFRKKDYINPLIGVANKKIVLGVASTWIDRKGWKDFIKLSEKLPEEYIVVMVGVSNKQRKLLPNNMIGICHTENAEQLVDLYNSAEIFLNLTYEDNFPTTNIESMACGTSVLTYKTGGSPESIISETGYVVEQGNINKVVEIVLSHRKTKETIDACVKHAKCYDKNTAFLHYVDLYKKNIRLK